MPLELVHDLSPDQPQPGAGLCLSGGGYRAMLFHLGSIWRLNELGILGTLNRISSVSGGSITSAVLGMNWRTLGFSAASPIAAPEAFQKLVVAPVRTMGSTTIDEEAILGGIFLPGTVADHVAKHYEKILFGGKTLQDLPGVGEGPLFVLNATNVQTGKLLRFSKPRMADWTVGQVLNPALPLARAVGASSAFPPVLSPAQIELAAYGLTFEPFSPATPIDPRYSTKLTLTDGGVYDNLGLETVWKRCQTVMVSDGGARFKPEPAPHTDWALHAYRVLDIIDSQVRDLRVRQLKDAFANKERSGSYWRIATDLAHLTNDTAIPCTEERVNKLAEVPTRLKAIDPDLQERLINWGYLVTDIRVRGRGLCPGAGPATALPYPAAAL